MKKIALILALVAVVTAGTLFTGVTIGGGGRPTIAVSPSSGPAGTQVLAKGWGFAPGTVALYMDLVDPAHLLATTTASAMGCFKVCFKMTATTVGEHQILCPTTPQASATFTLTVTEPLDERTDGLLSGIGDEVNNIEAKLDDLKGSVVRMETLSDNITISDTDCNAQWFVEEDYHGDIRHVSLTVAYKGNEVAPFVYDTVTVYLWCDGQMIDHFWTGEYSVNWLKATVEFDTDHWALVANNCIGDPLQVYCNATVTYAGS